MVAWTPSPTFYDTYFIINHNKNTITFLYELTLELTDIGNGACT